MKTHKNRLTWTAVWVTLALLALRTVQVMATDEGNAGWWIIEFARWGLFVGIVGSLAYTLDAISREVTDQKARLREIAAEATLARLDIDVMPLDDYPERV